MKRILLSLLILCSLAASSCTGKNGDGETEVLLQTTEGDIRIKLFNDTPLHRDNFIKNVKEGKYDGVTFHRIIRSFMIQTGDPNTRPGHEAELAAAEADTTNTLGETIPAEFVYPKYFHKRGMVAAAREGDDINPKKGSDPYQFYIVTGKFQNETALAEFETARKQALVEERYAKKMAAHRDELETMRKARNRDGVSDLLEKLLDQAKMEVDDLPETAYEFNQEQIRAYRIYGGAPWLDGSYTIFGEVVEGMKIVLEIEKVKTGAGDKPLRDIRITKASIVE
ncbi:MAG: peptidylprolyl isomerase [Bacteroidaceae bacterium]|jgi:peptidylprolyl isomerase|nr:peptidylprolyl isomerase [Bacteroidaceae bacterium]MBQ3628431.1 peptidylprolyl isomerase [Bacteroidaceae bacterium]